MTADNEPEAPLQVTRADAAATALRALKQTRASLKATREQRDRLNDQIRVMSAEADTLASVVGAFDRRARVEEVAAKPIRRTAPEGTS